MMKAFFSLPAMLLFAMVSGDHLGSCCKILPGSEGNSKNRINAESVQGKPGATTLSQERQNQIWTSIFNGRSLKGWRGYHHHPTGVWQVQNGTLHCLGSSAGPGAIQTDLITDKRYGNFDLSLEWKISPRGNSGILYHVTEKDPQSYDTGPEYQIIDDVHYPEKLEDWQHTGANYAMEVPSIRPVKPVGEWNLTRIRVEGAHVEYWLNGQKILDFQMWDPAWRALKNQGKWKDYPDYGMAPKGYIALQDHGDQVWFRQIKIRP
ncbi:MAG: 3-keto-disaccharide hydrolase [Chitinophagaceae bacterium]